MSERRNDGFKGTMTDKLQPSSALLELIRNNSCEKDKHRDVFSRQEIITHLRTYITQHELYDVRDPRLNYCDDTLRKVFGVKQFTISQVLPLIASSTTLVKSPTLKTPTIRGGYDVIDGHVIRTTETVELLEKSKRCKKRKRSEREEDEFGCEWKRRRNSSSFSTVILTSDDDGRWSVDVALHSDLDSCIVWSSDDETPDIVIECYDDASERLSIQSKETMLIEEMEEQDFWISEGEDGIDISIQPFSVEYDVISSSSDGDVDVHELETSSEPEADGEPEVAAMLVVCRESDVEFFADYSDSEEEDGSDKEIPSEDKWFCECGQKNTPLSRYCQKCWGIRPGWVQQNVRRRHVPAKYQVHPDYLSDMDDDSPIPLQEAIIASLTTSEPANQTQTPGRLDSVDGTPELLDSQTSGYFSQNSMQSTTPTMNDEAKPGPSGLCNSSRVSSLGAKPMLSRSKSYEHASRDVCWASPSLERTSRLQRSRSTQDKHGHTAGLSEISLNKWLSSTSTQNNATAAAVENMDKKQDSVQTSDVTKQSSQMDAETSTQSGEKDSKSDRLESQAEMPGTAQEKTENKKVKREDDDNSAMCIMCLSRPKNASLIHGKTGHQTTCYKCAKKLRRRGKPCPVCRKTIQRVIRNFIV